MRPTDLAQRLNRLAELAPVGDAKLRRVLENIDLVAQGALDNEATYVNKKGEAITVEQPAWAIVLQAQKLAASLLGIDVKVIEEQKGAPAPVARIMAVRPATGSG